MITSYEILPGRGVEQALFGEERAVHRERLGGRTSFERVPGSGLIDGYNEVTLMLSYDEQDRLKEIEVGGADLLLKGVQLVDRPLGEVLEDLRSVGLQAEFVGDSAYALSDLGVFLVTPAPEEPDVPIESVSIRPI